MSALGAVIVLAVVVWIFFAVSYMSSKNKSQDKGCNGGACDGNCMNCSFGNSAPKQEDNKNK